MHSPSSYCQVNHQKIAQMQINNTMTDELIVDFPEHSHRYCQNLECKIHAAGRESSSHQASSRSHSQDRCRRRHRHQQPEMSTLRSKSRNNDSSNNPGCSDSDHSCSSRPSQAGAARSVHFAEKSLLKLVTKHADRQDVDRQDLWYSEADLELMKLAALKDVLKVRDQLATGVPIDYFLGENDNDDSIVCLMGIESRYSRAHIIEVKACRERCVHAVLQEQERQHMMAVSSSLLFTDWQRQDLIALASFSQTRNAATRARKLGLLHQASVKRM